jgi:SOS response regulatory protein OraA/RecX
VRARARTSSCFLGKKAKDMIGKMENEEEKAALKYAFRVLGRRSYFSQELQVKLQAKGFSEDTVEKTILYCQTKGYLNDQAKTERLIIQEQQKGRGPKWIAAKLQAKGLLTRDLLQTLQSSDQKTSILALLPKLQKRHEEKQKLFQALARRGFDSAAILSCLDKKSKV